jgi:hypothetical protein
MRTLPDSVRIHGETVKVFPTGKFDIYIGETRCEMSEEQKRQITKGENAPIVQRKEQKT